MRTSRKRRAVVTAGCLASLLIPLTPAHAAAPVGQPVAGTALTAGTVTLITGDVVTVNTSGRTISVARPDGGPADARVVESGGDVYVYPNSALAYLAGGKLDRRLFNVTDLIADGYDDAHRDDLPLIVSYGEQQGLRANAAPAGAELVRPLASVGGAAITADHARASDFWTSLTGKQTTLSSLVPDNSAFTNGIERIWLDGKVYPDLAESVAQIGAPAVWAGGNTGEGVDVAVLDTGVDATHPDLVGRIAETRSFIAGEDTTDVHGHGTHVASTIAGTGAASGGTEKGVAPGARLHIGKVLSNAGSGSDSEVLAGMEWAATEARAKVINMSLGNQMPSDGTDPLSQAVNRLSAQTGALFVIAAGNEGGSGSVSAPGAADAALTVGAVDAGDQLAGFSNQGPRAGDGALKPEVTAPGVDISAARSQHSGGEGYYATHSGTSMATPHVVGAAALLAAQHPDLTGAQLKDLLTSTTKRTPDYTAFQAGSGRVDVAAAAKTGIFASATAYAGQNEPAAVQRPVTYTNLGAAPVNLDLSLDAPGVPQGVFRLSDQRVTVPAHGTAKVTVTLDPKVEGSGSDGFSGQVLAKAPGGALAAHTAVSLGGLTHKITLNVKDATGAPANAFVMMLRAGDPNPIPVWVERTTTFYLPRDHYSALAFMAVRGAHGPNSQGLALVGDPDFTLDKDTTITLDGTKVRLVDKTTPQASASSYLRLEYSRMLHADGRMHDFGLASTSVDSLWVQAQEKVTHGEFALGARWRKEQPALALSVRGDDYTDVLRQSGVTPLADGTRNLDLVFAGDGTNYKNVNARGKAVVVRRTDALAPAALAKAAADAGAKLLIVANDRQGRERLYFGASTIDVALLSRDEGEKLIGQAQRRGAELRAESHPVPSYLYDIAHTWHNDLPKNMVVPTSKKNLARIDENFAATSPGGRGEEWRYDFPAYTEWGIGNYVPVALGTRRTDWVSTDGDNRWGHEVTDGVLNEWGVRRKYVPASTTKDEWFKPVQRPYLNNNYLGPARTDNQLRIDVPGYGNADHTGSMQDWSRASQTTTLYQGDTRLAGSSSGLIMYADLAKAESQRYRLVVENKRDATVSPHSTATTTTWTFNSAKPKVAGTRELLPLLQIRYGLQTDGDGTVSRDAKFGITVEQRAAVSVGLTDIQVGGGGRVGKPRVEVSYDDGASWSRLSEHGGQYRFDAPRKAHFASLRVSGDDSAGNTVSQTVLRAVGLR
ncbi:S8 family serine peptidase [Lentzea sp. JNUCC 0626]|uniref:S8 family serine peptidase n=1 Tax=Lentzea sp. JNUCC 0626 TaxID=3367513 RepID=UPI003748F9DF